jgi:hypothetical protein
MNMIKIFSNRLTPILTAAVVAGIGIGAFTGASAKVLFYAGLVLIIVTIAVYLFLKGKI